MTRIGPPAWAELLLRSLLSARDREAIAGDLYEEFGERRDSPQDSRRARLWYLVQIISFAPRRCRSALNQPRTLAILCVFTALCGCWLGVMDFKLRHPGYQGQAAIAAAILLQALLTLVALHFQRNPFLRHILIFSCFALIWLAAKALIATIRGADMEGYILLIAVALLFQASLTLCTLPGSDGSGRLV
jgi:hypothetical protein